MKSIINWESFLNIELWSFFSKHLIFLVFIFSFIMLSYSFIYLFFFKIRKKQIPKHIVIYIFTHTKSIVICSVLLAIHYLLTVNLETIEVNDNDKTLILFTYLTITATLPSAIEKYIPSKGILKEWWIYLQK